MKFLLLLIITTISLANPAIAGGGHGHEEHHEQAQEDKGPNGGKLLQQDHFALEVTMVENGAPAEMRIFAYEHGQVLNPQQVQLTLNLKRIDENESMGLSPEKNYWVSDRPIKEPHSYDVLIQAQYEGQSYQWQYESHEGRTTISKRLQKLSQLKTQVAGPHTLIQNETLFGVVSAPQDKVFNVYAPFTSIVEKVHVNLGEQVTKGQTLLTLKNVQSLQTYQLKSPSKGEVTQRLVNRGDKADDNLLLEISDLSQVWVNLSAFPENIEKLAIGQAVEVYDLHQHERSHGTINYLAPQMTGGHIARARAIIDNSQGHWRPGMHVKADIQVSKRTVPLAVKKSALQSFRDFTVAFAQFGDQFEVRMLELGEQDDSHVEVLSGIKPGTPYVSENSFVIKADILKSGAAHHH